MTVECATRLSPNEVLAVTKIPNEKTGRAWLPEAKKQNKIGFRSVWGSFWTRMNAFRVITIYEYFAETKKKKKQKSLERLRGERTEIFFATLWDKRELKIAGRRNSTTAFRSRRTRYRNHSRKQKWKRARFANGRLSFHEINVWKISNLAELFDHTSRV